MAYYLKDLFFTEEGKKLKLSDEDRERFRLVYKREGDGWVLHDIFEKGGEYGDDCIVVPLQSTYRGADFFETGQSFENVQGSTGDPKPVGRNISWIDFWRCMYLAIFGTVPPEYCCTDGCLYNIVGGARVPNFNCRNIHDYNGLVGGHVIKGVNAVQPWEGAVVYIAPICRRHNNSGIGQCYMITGQRTFVVMLNYRVNPYAYLAQRPLETHEKI